MATPASRYVQTYNSMPRKKVKDDYFVHKKDVILITQFKDKIENVYQIIISFEQKTEEGQWLNLDGEPVDRRNAKNYITAMCNPMERKRVQFPSTSCTELTDPATLGLIEKRTNAFIRPLEKIAQFEISGTELAVTLAFSEIEELAGAALEGGDNQFTDEANVDADGVIIISPNTRNGSIRLSSVLEKALSANSDGVCSVEDYRHAKPAIQRVLANCLQNDDDDDDIDDEQLFADGPTDGTLTGSKLMMFYEGSPEERNAGSEVDVDRVTEVQTVQTSPPGAFTDKMTELAISNPPSTALLTKQQDYLHSFGVLVGFQKEEVDKAIKYVDEKTRPSDFLDMLNSLQQQDDDSGDDVVILETETIDLTPDANSVQIKSNLKGLTNDEQSSHTPNEGCDTSKAGPQNQGTDKSYQSTLPDGYKEMLFRDFYAEDGNCSADELKRRNAERQELLRQNFDVQQNNQQVPETKGTQPNSVVSNKQNPKGRGRRKNKQRNAEKQLDKTDMHDKQRTDMHDKQRTDMHDKQFRLDSGKNNNETYSHIDEETCVLRVWNNDQNQTGAGTSAQEPVQTTPKRKNSKGKKNQTQLSQPILFGNVGNNQRQNSPNRSNQPGGQWPQPQSQKFNQHAGSPGRGQHFRKPTQVVTPVNAANGSFNKMALQEKCRNNRAKLRYVVIDGSNVAMSHGNGKYFSCKGIKLCVDYFRQHGHDNITVFVPQWRQYRPSGDNPILDQDILRELKEEDILVFTPSRRIGRRLVVAYDDRFVLELAEAEDGVIVSNDQYRDLMTEKAGWRKLIEERLLMYSFVKDRFMLPNDPLGREGPCLSDFLRVLKPHQFTPVNPRHWQAYDYHQEQQQHYQSQGQLQQIQGQGQQGQGQFDQYQGQFQQGHGQFQHDQGHLKQGHGQYANANRGNNSENNQSIQKHGYNVKYKSNQCDETDCGDPSIADHVIGQWKNPQQGDKTNVGDTSVADHVIGQWNKPQQGDKPNGGDTSVADHVIGQWNKPKQGDKTDGGDTSVADHVIGQWNKPQQGYSHVKDKVQTQPRTSEETENLLQELRRIFPEPAQKEMVYSILTNHERERDLTKLTNYLMNVLF